MPEDLGAQVAPLQEAALGWPVLIVEGGGRRRHRQPGRSRQARRWRTVISTGDKDFAQLVEPRVCLVNTMSNELR